MPFMRRCGRSDGADERARCRPAAGARGWRSRAFPAPRAGGAGRRPARRWCRDVAACRRRRAPITAGSGRRSSTFVSRCLWRGTSRRWWTPGSAPPRGATARVSRSRPSRRGSARPSAPMAGMPDPGDDAEAVRRRYLAGQMRALAVAAGRLAGASASFADEAAEALGVRPPPRDAAALDRRAPGAVGAAARAAARWPSATPPFAARRPCRRRGSRRCSPRPSPGAARPPPPCCRCPPASGSRCAPPTSAAGRRSRGPTTPAPPTCGCRATAAPTPRTCCSSPRTKARRATTPSTCWRRRRWSSNGAGRSGR